MSSSQQKGFHVTAILISAAELCGECILSTLSQFFRYASLSVTARATSHVESRSCNTCVLGYSLPIGVDQKVCKVEKLGYEFFEVATFLVDRIPRGGYAVELSVSAVKLAAL